MAATVARAQAITRRPELARRLPAVTVLAVCAIGAALRFANFGAVPTTPFYDAAVRTMGLSWHSFFYGALDPSGRVSIDKMPLDLWLQVATTKLLGFSSVSLRLPPAIAGALAVVLLYAVVRRAYGRWAGIAAAAALAVLPVSVLTSRSDTMDSVMACLLVLAAWLIVRARPEHRARGVVGAGAVAGLAFEVKLFEAAVALPALAVLAWVALEPPAGRRLRTLALAGLAFLVVAASWPVVASALPGQHPFPQGSTNGQIWNVVLVYNGLHRVGNAPLPATGPGILRLFRTTRPREFGPLLGVELLPALVIGALAVVCAAATALPAGPRDDGRRLRRAVGWGLGSWLVVGTLVASLTGRQFPRYLEAFTPAVAGVIGIGIVVIARAAARRPAAAAALIGAAAAAAIAGRVTGGAPGAAAVAFVLGITAALVAALAIASRERLPAVAAALVVLAALAVPLATSVRLVRAGAGDGEPTGERPAAELDRLSAYLRAHQSGARYEVAGSNILVSAALVIKDARPVLTLTSVGPRELVTPAELAHAGRSGQVRYALLGGRCAPGRRGACLPVVRWVRSHGRDVSRAAGLPRRGLLYRLPQVRSSSAVRPRAA
jgi:4-amino-4-deoxy-L-arabinose transferase-like glycosyltransferase